MNATVRDVGAALQGRKSLREASGDPVPSRLAGMSTISREEVARLAGLARIDLTETEVTRLAGELDVIVESVARVSEVATEDVPATSHPIPLTNVFRDDVVEVPLDTADALSGAPQAEDGRFMVPQILGEDA
jgi:aspartyl-tRNA(Asn)/glutamyl-tRNA(Gln) amidotransferase subunit C